MSISNTTLAIALVCLLTAAARMASAHDPRRGERQVATSWSAERDATDGWATVLAVETEPRRISVLPDRTGMPEWCDVAPGAEVLLDGSIVPLHELRAGDRVELTFDRSGEQPVLVRIEATR